MFGLYWFALGLGGVFLLLTTFLGADTEHDVDHGGIDVDHGDFDFDGSIDADGDFDADMQHTSLQHIDMTHPGIVDILFLFISIRFWSFFTAFFGLTGVGLTIISGDGLFTLITSIIMGTLSGLGASILFKYMSRGNISSDVSLGEFLGQEARVLLPLDTEEEGKIRVIVKGQIMDKIAISKSGLLNIGDKVIIVKVFPNGKLAVAKKQQDKPKLSQAPDSENE